MAKKTGGFLPISKEDMVSRGWYYCDFLIVTGDAYVDHPSFGTAVISRVLEDAGYRVAILSQPRSFARSNSLSNFIYRLQSMHGFGVCPRR